MAAAACSGGTSKATPTTVTPTTVTPPSLTTTSTSNSSATLPLTTTPASPAAVALSSVRVGYGTATQSSGVVPTPEGRLAFVASSTGNSAIIDVLSDAGGAWLRVARVGSSDTTSDQYLESLHSDPSVAPVVPAYLTGSNDPDVPVLLTGGSLSDFIDGVVVSDAGNIWHFVPFLDAKGSPGLSLELADPKIAGSSIIESINPCVPDFARDQQAVVTTFRYDATAGEFTPSS